MRVLLIDNYDSFTFNLAHQIERLTGHAPLVYRNDEITLDQIHELAPQAVVLSPGPGHPENPRDVGVCRDILAHYRGPLLGVCLGHQAIASHSGALIELAREPMHGRIRRVRHADDPLFAQIPEQFAVTRYHSWTVSTELPHALLALAWSDEGEIMALRHRNLPHWGVQFHPESIGTEYGDQLIENFLRLASAEFTPRYSISQKPRTSLPINQSLQLLVNKRPLSSAESISAIFETLTRDRATRFFLGSEHTPVDTQRFIYFGDDSGPLSELIEYRLSDKSVRITRQAEQERCDRDIFFHLSQQLKQRRIHSTSLPFDFQCGYVGYFGYELKALCGGDDRYSSPHNDAMLLFADRVLVYDKLDSALYAVALSDAEHFDVNKAWVNDVLFEIDAKSSSSSTPSQSHNPIRMQRDAVCYLRDIDFCRDKIRTGESYEVCLTNQFSGPTLHRPLESFWRLSRENPAPYAAYLQFENLAIISASPECFLKADHTGKVVSRPIKGTIKRVEPGEDLAQIASLRDSEKERAENLMIVDLVRNDLSRVCVAGSVRVPQLMGIESYATLHQMVSTVEGVLRNDQDFIACLRAAFPGGSMTGAPKIRTMQIIDELEQAPRGIYSGAMGFLSVTGSADLGMVIRTIVVTPEASKVGAGGAITALSDPQQELAEMQHKASVLCQLIKQG